jgi:hypothetical protein
MFILTLSDQKKRLGELLHAGKATYFVSKKNEKLTTGPCLDCQLDELCLLRSYVKKCFPFPVNVDWIDPDVEQPKPVEVQFTVFFFPRF